MLFNLMIYNYYIIFVFWHKNKRKYLLHSRFTFKYKKIHTVFITKPYISEYLHKPLSTRLPLIPFLQRERKQEREQEREILFQDEIKRL